jgi:hypothetical protein
MGLKATTSLAAAPHHYSTWLFDPKQQKPLIDD